jgi:hypothetical protein
MLLPAVTDADDKRRCRWIDTRIKQIDTMSLGTCLAIACRNDPRIAACLLVALAGSVNQLQINALLHRINATNANPIG